MSLFGRNRKTLSALTSRENQNIIVPPPDGEMVIPPPPPTNKFNFDAFNTESQESQKNINDSYSNLNLTSAINNANLNKPTGNVVASDATNVPKYQIPEVVDVKQVQKDKEENLQKELDKSYRTSDYGLINVEDAEKRQTQENIRKENKKYPHSKDAIDAKRDREEGIKKQNELYQQQQKNKIADKIHTGLDVVGAVPGIGAVGDLINSGLYDIEGDTENRNLSLGAAIPLGGLGVTMGKYGKKGYKAGQDAGIFGFGKKAKQKKLNKEIALKEDWDKINTEYDIANKAPFLKNPEGKPIMNILNPPKNDGLDNPDYSLVKKLIGEASDPNTARRLKGLGADPEQFQSFIQNNMRFVDDPTEGAYFSPSRNQINMGNATNKDLHFGLQGNKTYPVGGHELYGHGVQEFIGRFNPSRNMSNFPGTTPAQNSTNPTTWLDRAFQDHVRNSAPDSDFIKKHGYSENPDTDYLFNTGPASGQEGVWGIGRGGGNRKSQEAVPYLSEMRREMGGALNRSYDDIFSLDDINAFAKTSTGKTNRVLNTGIPRDHMMASFLDHAPMLGSAIAAGGTLGALSGNNNKNQQGVGSQ